MLFLTEVRRRGRVHLHAGLSVLGSPAGPLVCSCFSCEHAGLQQWLQQVKPALLHLPLCSVQPRNWLLGAATGPARFPSPAGQRLCGR